MAADAPIGPPLEAKAAKVIRDMVKAHRGDYFVEYHAAQPPYCAVLNLTFPQRAGDLSFVRAAMEQEMEFWLRRYAVPVMIHGLDEKESGIRFSSEFGASTLMGYREPGTGRIVHRWGLFRDAELPAAQLEESYLATTYHDVPFRLAAEVREKAGREQRRLVRSANILVFFIVLVPVLIEIIALGVTWLGHVTAAISITVGLYKAAKTFGWIKRSKGDEAESAAEQRMRHHHHHCEKNPRAFERLRAENFALEAAERVRRDDESLRATASVRGSGKT